MARYEEWRDDELIDEMDEYDGDGVLTDWEADFYDDILKQKFPLTKKQKTKMIEIIREKEDV